MILFIPSLFYRIKTAEKDGKHFPWCLVIELIIPDGISVIAKLHKVALEEDILQEKCVSSLISKILECGWFKLV